MDQISFNLARTQHVGLAEVHSVVVRDGLLICTGLVANSTASHVCIFDVISALSVATFKLQGAGSNSPLMMKYVRNTDRLVIAVGDAIRMLTSTPVGTYLINTAVNRQTASRPDDALSIELPFPDAHQLLKSLKSLLSKEGQDLKKNGVDLDELKRISDQLDAQTSVIAKAGHISNKHIHFTTVTFTSNYRKLKTLLNTLITKLPDQEIIGIAHCAQEILRRNGEQIRDVSGFHSRTKGNNMHVELNRLKTFTNWPETRNPDANPATLSRFGFFFQPNVQLVNTAGKQELTGTDLCAHFSCSVQVGNWDQHSHPLAELAKVQPDDAFVQGRPTSNVPLAYSFNAIAAQHSVDKSPIEDAVAAPHTSLVITRSAKGFLSVWDTAVELKLQYCFNPRNGELVTRDDPAPEPSGNDKDPERDGRLVRVLLLHSPSESSAPITQAEQSASAGKGARKWEQWCTADIEVFVDKGPYTGTKGVVFDIISKDSICVFLSGLGEAINLPLSQLAPFKPKAKQRVKVLSGEHKGKDGTMLAVQGTTTAVVRLTTKQIVTIQIGALASMPNPDSDSGDTSTARAYNTCAVALFTLPDASRLTVYELAASEPKYMQSHAFDFHGQALCADYASSSKTVYVAYEQLPPYSDEPIYTLAWFTFDEKQKRLISHASAEIESLRALKDAPAKLRCIKLERTSREVLIMMTHQGRLLTFDPSTAALIKVFGEAVDNTSRFCDLVYLRADDQFVMVSTTGKVCVVSIYYNDNEANADRSTAALASESSIQLTSADMLDLLGPITFDNLSTLAKFETERLQFAAFAPPSVRSSMLQNNTFVRWNIPPTDPYERSELSFEVELATRRRIDTLELELRMARAWLGLDDENLGHKYRLSLLYHHTTQGWLRALDDFDLTGIISSGDHPESDDPKLRLGAITVPGITARRLLLTLRSVLPVTAPGMDGMDDGSMARRFVYSSDFDEQGLIYWIGTNGGKEPFKNPAEDGRITIELSHEKTFSKDMKKHDVIARKPSQSLYWGGGVPQWFMVDLGPNYRLMADNYTLRHGYQHANSYLQNWCMQGSADAEDWVTLHEGGETPFTKGFDTRTFPIKDGKEHFRYFRVLQKGTYCMGPGKSGGSAFMCIAGFELYGELLCGNSDKPSPNLIYTMGVKFATLKPTPGMTVEKTIARRKAVTKSQEFHKKMLQRVCDSDTVSELRMLCLDMLLDVWRRKTDSINNLVHNMALIPFLQHNIIKAEKPVAVRGGRLLACTLASSPPSPTFKRKVLMECLNVLPKSVDEFECAESMTQLFDLIQMCWDSNPRIATEQCLRVLRQLGTKLYDNRSPFYNILRKYYGLYGHPLELVLFDTPPPVVATTTTTGTASMQLPLSTPNQSSTTAPTPSTPTGPPEKLTRSSSDLRVRLALINPESKDALEEQFLGASLEFAAARRALTTQLEQINVNGESFGNYEKAVTKLYNACMKTQLQYHRIYKKLRKVRPETAKPEDCKLSRWTSAAERLFSVLNEQMPFSQQTPGFVPDAASRMATQALFGSNPSQVMVDMFSQFCVYGTAALRKEAATFIMSHLIVGGPSFVNAVAFPSTVLQRFFSQEATEDDRPISFFPQQEVFDTLQEIVSEDRLRFFCADELFSLLEESTRTAMNRQATMLLQSSQDPAIPSITLTHEPHSSAVTPATVNKEEDEEEEAASTDLILDIYLVSWLLLLLSDSMAHASDNEPVHKGSKCRNCNMSPICGIRYRCVNCVDYDLCEQCEESAIAIHAKSHLFLKIPAALPLPPSHLTGIPIPKEPLLPVLYMPSQNKGSNSMSTAESHGVICDGCGKNIKGTRYKCVHCDEFDFCEACEPRTEHFPHHLFLKIRKPLPSMQSTAPPPSGVGAASAPVPSASSNTEQAASNPKALIPVLLHHGFYPAGQYKNNSSSSATSLSAHSPPWLSKLSRSVTDASKLKEEEQQQIFDGPSRDILRSSSSDVLTKLDELPRPVIFDGRYLRSIFNVIALSARMQPLSPELLLLAVRVLEGLTSQYMPQDIAEDVFKHPDFDEFLNEVATYPSSFIKSAVLQMVDRLMQPGTYNCAEKESAHSLKQMRGLLRHKAMKLLRESPNTATFLWELLLVVTTEKDMKEDELGISGASSAAILGLGTATNFLLPDPSNIPTAWAAASAPISPLSDSPPQERSWLSRVADLDYQYPLDEIVNLLVNYLIEDLPLSSSSNARSWCMVFRLLHFADPAHVVRSSGLVKLVHQVVLASEELQVLVVEDFIKLLRRLLSRRHLAPILLSSIVMEELVSCFAEVWLETNTMVYFQLIQVLEDHLSADVKFQTRQIVSLLTTLADYLPDPVNAHVGDAMQNQLIKEVLDMLITIIHDGEVPINISSMKDLFYDAHERQPQDDEDAESSATASSALLFSEMFLTWLSNLSQQPGVGMNRTVVERDTTSIAATVPSTLASVAEAFSKRAMVTKADLGATIMTLIKIMGEEEDSAKHLLAIALDILRSSKPNSVALADICMSLITSEHLAYYFLVEIDGASFFFDQIKSSNTRVRTSFLAPAFASILSHTKGKTQPTTPAPSKKAASHKPYSMENLAPMSELLTPKGDKQLERVLKESTNLSSLVWTHNFRTHKDTHDDKHSIEIAIPDNVILREIRIDCVGNYNSNSRFPRYVTVSSGTAINRLLPVGRFACKAESVQTNPSTRYNATFKFPLPEIEVVKFVKLIIHPPEDSSWVAISRIQLMGHSNLLYTSGKEAVDDPLLLSQLPLSLCLDLLDQTLRYDRVLQQLAEQRETTEFALALLNILTPKTSATVQHILSCLAKYDTDLSDTLLDELLLGQTTAHAALAGKLCGLSDTDTTLRLTKLSDYVFKELATHNTATTLTSHIISFLDAFSDAIASSRLRGLPVGFAVTEQQVRRLFSVAVSVVDGSLMQQGCLRLLSSMVQSHPQSYNVLVQEFELVVGDEPIDKMLLIERDPIATASVTAYDALNAIGLVGSSSSHTAQLLLSSSLPNRLLKAMRTVMTAHVAAQDSKDWTTSLMLQRFLEIALRYFSNIAHEHSIKSWIGQNLFGLLFELCSARGFGSKVLYAVQEVLRASANLHVANQERIAAYLLRQLRGAPQQDRVSTLNSFMLQLMVDMFSLEDKVAVALHPLNGSEAEVPALTGRSATRTEHLKLDRAFCHPNLDMDDDQQGVSANANSTTGWRTILAEKSITSGVRRWEVCLEKITATANVMIGVCERSHKLNAYIGQNQSGKGWSYYGATTGYTYHDGKSDSRYGQKMVTGDVISVTLDMDEGTLSFSRNGEDLGVAFRGLSGREVYPAISLYDAGDRVRVQEIEGTTIDKGPLSESRLAANSPVMYQRQGPLFSLPTTVTLARVVDSLITDTKQYEVIFELITPAKTHRFRDTDLGMTLGELYKLAATTGEVIDITFDIVPREEDEEDVFPAAVINKLAQLAAANNSEISSVLKHFAEQNGLALLVDLIDAHLQHQQEQEEKLSESGSLSTPGIPGIPGTPGTPGGTKQPPSPATPKSAPAPSGGFVTPPSGTSTPPTLSAAATPVISGRGPVGRDKIRPPVAVWRNWAGFLQMLLRIDGYVNNFVQNVECRSLLFYFMTETHSSTATATAVSSAIELAFNGTSANSLSFKSRPQTVREISSKLGIIKDSIPPPSDKLLSNPLQPLYETLFDLLRFSQRDVKISLVVRQRMLETGILRYLLSEMIPLCDVMPRRPGNPAFAQAIEMCKKIAADKAKEKKTQATATPVDGKYWAKGTGYGTASDESANWNHEQYIKEQAHVARKVALLLEAVHLYLSVVPSVEDKLDVFEQQRQMRLRHGGASHDEEDSTDESVECPEQPEIDLTSYSLISDSALAPLIETYLRNDSLLDMGRHIELYDALLRTTNALVSHEHLIELVMPAADHTVTILTLLTKLHTMSEIVLKRLPAGMRANKPRRFVRRKRRGSVLRNDIIASSPSSPSTLATIIGEDEVDDDDDVDQSDDVQETDEPTTPNAKSGAKADPNDGEGEDEIALAFEIKRTYLVVKKSIENYEEKQRKIVDAERLNGDLDLDDGADQGSNSRASSGKQSIAAPEEEAERYKAAMEGYQFGESTMLDNRTNEYLHHYKTRIKADKAIAPKKMKRLVQEISALSSGLPLFLESTVLLRVDSERMDVMQSIITGPEGTPYAHGCFQFDIYCPPEYPSVPPVVNLQTTGNGSVRFNPNLYNCGKVCLSLLGTWRGSQNEKWNENASTLLQVFVSIQSLIFVDHPYFNEPGYESTMNTPKGDQQSRLYNEAIRMATVRWAMIDMLQNPTPGFEDAILCHFKLKRNRILKEVGEWVSEAKSTSYADKLQKLFDELKEELRAVDPDTPMPSDVVATPDSVDSNTANSMESEDKEVQRWNNAVSLADFVPGYTLALYVTALKNNSDKADLAINWLLESGETYVLDHPEVFALVPPPKATKALEYVATQAK